MVHLSESVERLRAEAQARAARAVWAQPGVEAVAPGVHRIPLPLPGDGLAAVNVYAVEDGGRLCLVDAGWAVDNAFAALEEGLAALGHGFETVGRVLVTHMHRDHYTMAVRMRRLFGTRIEVGIGERESIEAIITGTQEGQGAHLRGWGADDLQAPVAALHAAERAPELYELPDGWIAGPTDLVLHDRTLRALPTPGHTRGHLVFADLAAGLLFSGDHVLPHITPSIGFETVRADLPLRDFLQSLDLVRRLPDLLMLPAHGPSGTQHHQRVDELVSHHEERLTALERAVGGGAPTAYDAARAVTWTRRGRAFGELDTMNQLLAVGETAAHLDVLVVRGRLGRRDVDGRQEYGLV